MKTKQIKMVWTENYGLIFSVYNIWNNENMSSARYLLLKGRYGWFELFVLLYFFLTLKIAS